MFSFRLNQTAFKFEQTTIYSLNPQASAVSPPLPLWGRLHPSLRLQKDFVSHSDSESSAKSLPDTK